MYFQICWGKGNLDCLIRQGVPLEGASTYHQLSLDGVLPPLSLISVIASTSLDQSVFVLTVDIQTRALHLFLLALDILDLELFYKRTEKLLMCWNCFAYFLSLILPISLPRLGCTTCAMGSTQ